MRRVEGYRQGITAIEAYWIAIEIEFLLVDERLCVCRFNAGRGRQSEQREQRKQWPEQEPPFAVKTVCENDLPPGYSGRCPKVVLPPLPRPVVAAVDSCWTGCQPPRPARGVKCKCHRLSAFRSSESSLRRWLLRPLLFDALPNTPRVFPARPDDSCNVSLEARVVAGDAATFTEHYFDWTVWMLLPQIAFER